LVMKSFFAILLFFVATVVPVYAVDTPLKNAGFAPSNIWYSRSPFFSGDSIRIYTIIFNGSSEDLIGVVEFLDNGILIGKTDFSLASGGRARDVWVDWVAKDGKHTITARLSGVHAVGTGGKKRPIVLENIETAKNELAIDFDTDRDGIGNTDDLDDDNDNVSDIDEIKNSTDPLKKDSDGNGVSDDKELKLIEARAQTATGTKNLGVVENAMSVVDSKIPEPIKEAVSSGSNIVERFRISEGYQFKLAKEEKSKEIDALNERNRIPTEAISTQKEKPFTETVRTEAEKPLAYVSYFVLAVLQYFFEYKVIFYVVVFYILYRALKWVTQKIRRR